MFHNPFLQWTASQLRCRKWQIQVTRLIPCRFRQPKKFRPWSLAALKLSSCQVSLCGSRSCSSNLRRANCWSVLRKIMIPRMTGSLRTRFSVLCLSVGCTCCTVHSLSPTLSYLIIHALFWSQKSTLRRNLSFLGAVLLMPASSSLLS